jgi:hypothetical protein
MKILRIDRGKGKTTELVKLSNKEWLYIVCRDRERAKVIVDVAKFLLLDIPFPITLRELPLRSPHIKTVLVDDMEDLLEAVIGKHIEFGTTSSEMIGVDYASNEDVTVCATININTGKIEGEIRRMQNEE